METEESFEIKSVHWTSKYEAEVVIQLEKGKTYKGVVKVQ
jgi:hypothetical protein